MGKLACAIIAYNRPQYLKWLLASLENQYDPGQVDYHLFIDGAKTKADVKKIKLCKEMFKVSNLPNREIHEREENVSIAINQFEAKEWLADRYEYFVIAEDDTIPSKHAIKITKSMQRFIKGKVFSAGIGFIRHCSTNELRKNLDMLYVHKKRHWWWEMYKRSQWLKVRPAFLEYYEFVKDVKYKNRPHLKIREFYKKQGFDMKKTSQDSGMDYALFKNDMSRIAPVVNRGMYIGVIGTHFDETVAAKYQFEKQVPYQFPTDADRKDFRVC